MKTLGIIFMLFMLCSSAAWEYPYPRKAVPTEAGESICGINKKLKDVAPWTQQKIAALRKTRDEYESKILDWNLHFHESPGCGGNESVLEEIHTALEAVNGEIKKLPAKAIQAGALAAKSAGRLDEFITVFANAKGGHNYCMGTGGKPAERRDLSECFSSGVDFEVGESNMATIPQHPSERGDTNLEAVIHRVNHSIMSAYFRRRYGEDAHADCNLIKGTDGGILVGKISEKLWWGGGILTIGSGFDGNISKLKGAKDKDSGEKTFWTASPHTIPHLKKTLAALQAFKDAAALISQKFSEIEKIEKQIEPCLSNETTEERPTQSCFKNAVKLNAELQAANALLARYHKEKGPLPSGSTLTLHQSVVQFLYLIAFLR
ncbi:Transferrin receptor-like, ESAG6-like [Trypanosoma congolense IL3000]|uniref:Transferrin receptor-like, ESAG6-like n=1 Tax=Trypanosoma congolense (strain IL3000) TaxID=1068625 RepID=F9WAW2_TRYCI|nr:Transferrin receptor-like, ESAG6-like [Trypanosoma congolense IL3000]